MKLIFKFTKKIITIPIFMTFLFVGSFEIGNINNSKYVNNLILNTEIISNFIDDNEQIKQISMGKNHSSALTNKANVFTWGYNYDGQLGNGSKKQTKIPQKITDKFKLIEGEQIIQLSMGGHHSSALTSKGNVYTWGYNKFGQLGDGSTEKKHIPTNITTDFNLPKGEKIIQLSMGGHHSSALTSKGNVYTWGYNANGQLGNGLINSIDTPTKITINFNLVDDERITELSMGAHHSSALTNEGNVYTWGYNYDGQLGNGTINQTYTPTLMTDNFKLIEKERITQLSMGGYHSSALTNKNNVYTWGHNYYGQLGDGTTGDKHSPKKITDHFHLDENEKITQLSLGENYSYVLTNQGNIYSYGDNSDGQLGDGTVNSIDIPILITKNFKLVKGERIIQLSMGGIHSAALTNKGSVYTWGNNAHGRLGRSGNHQLPGNVFFPNYILNSKARNITSNSAIIDFDLCIIPDNVNTKVTIWNNDQKMISKSYKLLGSYSIELNNLESNKEYNLSISVDAWSKQPIPTFTTEKYTSEDIDKHVDIKIKDINKIKNSDNKITLIYSQQPSLKGSVDHLITYKDGTKQTISISPDNKYSVNFEQTYNLDQSIINIKQTETFYEIDGYRVLLESHSGTKDKIFDHLKSKKGLSVGEIIVIVFSVMAGIVLIVSIIFLIYYFNKNNKLKTKLKLEKNKNNHLDDT